MDACVTIATLQVDLQLRTMQVPELHAVLWPVHTHNAVYCDPVSVESDYVSFPPRPRNLSQSRHTVKEMENFYCVLARACVCGRLPVNTWSGMCVQRVGLELASARSTCDQWGCW